MMEISPQGDLDLLPLAMELLVSSIPDVQLNTCLDLFSQFFIMILGFIKFLGPYYMLLITKRRKIGVICGHAVYAITKSEILPIPNSSVQPSVAYSKNENRSFVNSAFYLFVISY